MRYIKRKVSAFITSIMIMLVVQCAKEKEDVNLFVSGGPEIVYDYYPQSDTFILASAAIEVDIMTDPVFDTLSVEVNGESLVKTFQASDYEVTYGRSIPPEYIEYRLEINSDIGNASAVCQMPDRFKVTSPAGSQIPFLIDCQVTWETSPNAQWYEVLAWLNGPSVSKDTSITTSDTTVILDSNWLCYTGYLGIRVRGCNGGGEMDGEEGNISGNGKGFWIAKSSTEIFLDVVE